MPRLAESHFVLGAESSPFARLRVLVVLDVLGYVIGPVDRPAGECPPALEYSLDQVMPPRGARNLQKAAPVP